MSHQQLTRHEFEKFRKYIYDIAGISLSDRKINLVQTRLGARLRALRLDSFKEYYQYVTHEENSEEISHFLSAISTNVTSFFREAQQWDYLKIVIQDLEARGIRKLRIWSAACSTGQEPYSIMMFLHDTLKNIHEWDIKILATDISSKALKRAIDGQYSLKEFETVPAGMQKRFFEKVKKGVAPEFHIHSALKEPIVFRLFNLTRGNYGIFKKPFDIIFCRNVMIYFDQETRETLIKQFEKLIKPHGLLFIGHSESITQQDTHFKNVKPSIYQRT